MFIVLKVLILGEDARDLVKLFKSHGHRVQFYAEVGEVAGDFDIIWASPPCSGLSKAGAWKNWDVKDGKYKAKTQKAWDSVVFLRQTLEIMAKKRPKAWFIELPMGMARKFDFMQDLPRKTTTLCQYGLEFRKETDIWTNFKGLNLKDPCKNGDPCHKPMPRGVDKSGEHGGINVLWGDKRGKMPDEFCEAIVRECERLTKAELQEEVTCEQVKKWHDAIVNAMLEKGMNHTSPLSQEEGLSYKDKDKDKKKKDKEYADPGTSGVYEGAEITLDQILSYFSPAKIGKELVVLTGGVVNQGKTEGDIDILIKMMKDDPMAIPIQFRIQRMFPEELRKRLHFVFEDEAGKHVPGPYTSHVPLFDIDMQMHKPLKRVQMSELQTNNADVGSFIHPVKPTIGYKYRDKVGWEAVREVVKVPAIVQKKFDGARVQIHKNGDEVIAFSDDGHRIEHRMPSTVRYMRENWPERVIIDSEVEIWEKDKKLPREEISGFLRREAEITGNEDHNMVVNVFDLLYIDDMNIMNEPYEQRLSRLKKLKFIQSTDAVPLSGINRVPSYKAESKADVVRLGKRVSKKPFSEGAMFKVANSPVPKGGQTDLWWKYKITALFNVAVVERIQTATEGVYNYHMAMYSSPDYDVKDDEIRTVKSHRMVYVGKSMNTGVKLNAGDNFRVSAENFFRYRDRYRLYLPVLNEPTSDKPDTLSKAIDTAKDAGLLQVKYEEQSLGWPDEGKEHQYVMQLHFRGKSAHHDFRAQINDHLEGWTIFSQPAGKVKEDVDTRSEAIAEFRKVDWKWPKADVHAQASTKTIQPADWLKVEGDFDPGQIGAGKDVPGYMIILDEGQVEFGARKTWFYEYFLHGKNKVRLIFRYIPRSRSTSMAETKDMVLWDWKWIRLVGELVKMSDEDKVKRLTSYFRQHKGLNEAWQIFNYARNCDLTISKQFEDVCNKLQAEGSNFQYSEELQENVIKDIETKELRDVYNRVFDVMDAKEIRTLPTDLVTFADVVEDELIERGALQDRRSTGFWNSWVAKNPEPYVLSRGAVNEDWIPPQGISALPKEMRGKVPVQYRYWTFNSRAKRIQVRNDLRKAKEVKLHVVSSYDDNHHVVEHQEKTYLATTSYKLESKELTFGDVDMMCEIDLQDNEFVLIHHFWRGQQVVRTGPSTQHWDLFIGDKMWVLQNDPRKGSTNASVRSPYSKNFKNKGDGENEFIKPGDPGNPTKNTPSWVRRIDQGSVHMLEDSDMFKKFNLTGKELKGTFVLHRDEPNRNLWQFSKETANGKRSMSKGSGNVISQRIMLSAGKPYEKDGKLYVPGATLSYGVWNGDFYPPEVIADRPERLLGKPASIVSHRNRNNYGKVVELNFDKDTSTIHIVSEYDGDEAINRIKQGDLIGYSVEVTVEVDEDRHIVKKILDYDRTVLVPDPACEVCTVDGVCN